MPRLARVVDFEAPAGAPLDALDELDLAIADLRAGGDFAAKMRRLADRMFDSEVGAAARALMQACDLDGWIADCGSTWGRNALYPTLTWPGDERSELGLAIALVERFAKAPARTLDFVDEFYCIDGHSEVRLLHFVQEVIVPFGAQFREFLMRHRRSGAPLGAGVIVCGADDAVRRAICERLVQHAFDVHAIDVCAAEDPDRLLAACPPNDQVTMAIVILGSADVETRWLRRPSPGVASPGLVSVALLMGRLGSARVSAVASTEIHADWSACLTPPVMVTPDPASDWEAGLLARLFMKAGRPAGLVDLAG